MTSPDHQPRLMGFLLLWSQRGAVSSPPEVQGPGLLTSCLWPPPAPQSSPWARLLRTRDPDSAYRCSVSSPDGPQVPNERSVPTCPAGKAVEPRRQPGSPHSLAAPLRAGLCPCSVNSGKVQQDQTWEEFRMNDSPREAVRRACKAGTQCRLQKGPQSPSGDLNCLGFP